MKAESNFKAAFSRNLGWITADEQIKLQNVKVGIAGLGGVGGQYAEILARLGVHKFVIYDADQFSIENTNRQNGCQISNYGKNKAQVIGDLIRNINSDAQVEVHTDSLLEKDVDSFCKNIDIYLDGLDFFEVKIRMLIFARMRELQKTAVTVAPLGAGASLVLFTKNSMSFDDHFGLHTTQDPVQRSLQFLSGLSPSLIQGRYLQDGTKTNFAERRVPSLPMGVYSAASVMATTFMKVVLKRGPLKAAPWVIHYDPYLLTLKKNYVWMGYRNPLQKLKVWILKKRFNG